MPQSWFGTIVRNKGRGIIVPLAINMLNIKNIKHMPKCNLLTVRPNHDAIARSAYQLWEKAGSPSGQDSVFWFQAEAQLLNGALDGVDPLPVTNPEPTTAAAQPARILPRLGNLRPVGEKSPRSSTGGKKAA